MAQDVPAAAWALSREHFVSPSDSVGLKPEAPEASDRPVAATPELTSQAEWPWRKARPQRDDDSRDVLAPGGGERCRL